MPALEDIGEDILLELGRRLEDPEEAAKLPAGGLMSLAQKYVNYLDIKARLLKEQKNQEVELPVLELIQSNELEPARKKEILQSYISSLEADLAKANELLEELNGSS